MSKTVTVTMDFEAYRALFDVLFNDGSDTVKFFARKMAIEKATPEDYAAARQEVVDYDPEMYVTKADFQELFDLSSDELVEKTPFHRAFKRAEAKLYLAYPDKSPADT